MSRRSKSAVFVFILTTLAGSCLHFVYTLVPNPITALISPVNESLWEHLKILFWPGLGAALLLARREERWTLIPRLFSLLVAGAAMLAVGYGYHILLGGEALAFDLCLYVLLVALCFLLPCAFQKPLGGWQRALVLLLSIIVGVSILLFTFLPPGGVLFADLSGASS